MNVTTVELPNTHPVNTSEAGGPSGTPRGRYPWEYHRAAENTRQYTQQAQQRLTQYRNTANAAAQSAEGAIVRLEQFRFGGTNLNLTGAAHVSPNYITPGINPSGLDISLPGASPATGVLPASGITDTTGGLASASAPNIQNVTISDVPSLGQSPTMPNLPLSQDLSVSFPQTQISIPDSASVPQAPVVQFQDISLSAPMLPDELDAPDAGLGDLVGIADRLNMVMRGLHDTPVSFGALDVLTGVVQNMASGQPKGWMEQTSTERNLGNFNGVSALWSRRGMTAPSHEAHAQAYINARNAQERRYLDGSNAAAFSVAAYKEATDGARLTPVVFAAVQDLKIAKLDLDIRREIVRIGASVLNLITAAAEAEAYALQAKIRAAQARALGSAARAKAQGYRDVAQVADAQVDMNRTVARAYGAAQRAKQLQAQAYRSQVRAERAKMDAFLGQSSGEYDLLAARANQIGARIRGEIARYIGNITQIEGDFRTDAVRASAIAARNRAVASNVSSTGEISGAVVAQNSAIAAQTSAELSVIEANIREGSGRYLQDEVANAMIINDGRRRILDYQIKVITDGLKQEAESSRLEGQEREFRSAARHFVSLSESAMQTARICQQINAEAAEAESRLKISVGQARAAIESGRLAGFRASTSIEADYRFSASERGSLDRTEAYNASATQGNVFTKEGDAV